VPRGRTVSWTDAISGRLTELDRIGEFAVTDSQADDEIERESQRGPAKLVIGSTESDSRIKGAVACYIRVFASEGFEKACEQFHAALADALKKNPGKPIVIYCDIDNHRDSRGFLDVDMLDFQCIAYAVARKYASKISMPSIEAHPDSLPEKPPNGEFEYDRMHFDASTVPEGIELVNPLNEVDEEIKAFFRRQQQIHEHNRAREVARTNQSGN
jgi:hypothetical protein